MVEGPGRNFIWVCLIKNSLFHNICILVFVFQSLFLSWALFHRDTGVCCSVVVVMVSCCWLTVRGWVVAEKWVSLCSSLRSSLSLSPSKRKNRARFQPDPSDTGSVNSVFQQACRKLWDLSTLRLSRWDTISGVSTAVCVCVIMCENMSVVHVWKEFVCHHLNLA